MATPPKPSVTYFDEAVEFYARELKLNDKQLAAIIRRTTKRAVKAARLHQLRAADAVLKGIERAVRDGQTLADVRAGLAASVQRHVEGQPLELLFRNNIQASYSAGRVRQFSMRDTLAVRPYWMFDAIMDSRTSDICTACNGTVLPADAAWWKSHTPPLHHKCRSTIRALTVAQAEKRGIDDSPTRERPADGWGAMPPDAAMAVDTSGIDRRLKAVERRRVKRRR